VKVAVVDYGVGNLHSIRKSMELFGARVEITRSPKVLEESDAIVLPGVGAFSSALAEMPREKVSEEILAGKPVLGVCLGMQLFFDWSEEGETPGLGLLRGRVVRLPRSVKIPHIGWNTIKVCRNHPIVAGISSGSYVYFVHSYYSKVEDERIVISTSEYGVIFPAIVAHKNIIGTQFHPEKSGENGMRLLNNFISLIR
jgi:glutamine amidotransferase